MIEKSLKRQNIGLIIGLGIQYLLGIYTDLFVKFPENKTEVQNWEFAKSQIVLDIHMILGLLILFGAVVLFIRSIKAKDRRAVISSGIALLAVIGAVIGGEMFVSTQNDAYSLLMAISFIVALLSYFFAVISQTDTSPLMGGHGS